MEYVFCDTKKELQETYDYLDKVEAYLGKPIIRLNDERGFDHWLEVYGHYLPSPQMRWCTRQLKIRPFERFVGDDPVISYIGIRGDEHSDGYISSKPNITPRYPFKEDGITERDVYRILDESGSGGPRLLQVAHPLGVLLLLLPAQGRVVGAQGQPPAALPGRQGLRENRPTKLAAASPGRRARASTNSPAPTARTRSAADTSSVLQAAEGIPTRPTPHRGIRRVPGSRERRGGLPNLPSLTALSDDEYRRPPTRPPSSAGRPPPIRALRLLKPHRHPSPPRHAVALPRRRYPRGSTHACRSLTPNRCSRLTRSRRASHHLLRQGRPLIF